MAKIKQPIGPGTQRRLDAEKLKRLQAYINADNTFGTHVALMKTLRKQKEQIVRMEQAISEGTQKNAVVNIEWLSQKLGLKKVIIAPI